MSMHRDRRATRPCTKRRPPPCGWAWRRAGVVACLRVAISYATALRS